MPLQLRYVFTPSPNPIRASVGGAPANQVDLQVMVSNPGPDPVQLETITITIPVGQEGAHTLSDSPALPAPEYDKSSGWDIPEPVGSTVVLTPPAQGLLDSFLFTLPGIDVNDKEGVVPLTIKETAPPAPPVTDKTSYTLVKYEADFPITNFYVEPSTLYDLDRPVTLKWECSDQGKDYVYSVHSDGWRPDDCLNGGSGCLNCDKGREGVRSPKLRETTTFALDVIRTDSKGSRVIYKTLHATARMSVPSISQNSYQTAYCSGRVARLHWLAFDADYCTVSLDDDVIVDRAPTDTYEQGYLITDLIGQTGIHQLSVTAHARSGRAQATHNFPHFSINPFVSLGHVTIPWRIAVTPDGRLAFVGTQAPRLPVVDVEARKFVNPIALSEVMQRDVAVTPDGKLALVLGWSERLYVVDVESQKVVDSITLDAGTPGWNFPKDVAVTPDGKLALVAAQDGFVKFVDVAGRKVVDTVKFRQGGDAVAVTPDGKLAFVSAGNVPVSRDTATVSVIDVESRQVVGDPITVGGGPQRIAVTPDGRLALVATYDSGVYVIDVAGRKVVNTIKTDATSRDMVITPDGALAFLGSVGGGTAVTVIDVAGQRVVGAIDVGGRSVGLACTPDGRHLLVGRVLPDNPSDNPYDVIIL